MSQPILQDGYDIANDGDYIVIRIDSRVRGKDSGTGNGFHHCDPISRLQYQVGNSVHWLKVMCGQSFKNAARDTKA